MVPGVVQHHLPCRPPCAGGSQGGVRAASRTGRPTEWPTQVRWQGQRWREVLGQAGVLTDCEYAHRAARPDEEERRWSKRKGRGGRFQSPAPVGKGNLKRANRASRLRRPPYARAPSVPNSPGPSVFTDRAVGIRTSARTSLCCRKPNVQRRWPPRLLPLEFRLPVVAVPNRVAGN